MAKGDIDFKAVITKRANYNTANEYRLAMLDILDGNEFMNINYFILLLGFNNIDEFYNYKLDVVGFKDVRDAFINNIPQEKKEYLNAFLSNKYIRPDSSLTKEQRRVKSNLNSRLRSAIKGSINTSNFKERFGYTQRDLVKHLESFFNEEINWNTYGRFGWHIDHIKPCSSYDWSKDIDKTIKECFALSNLRPLNWRENIIKGNKYECA